MKNNMFGTLQCMNVEDVPDEFEDEVWDQLPVNGGNCISVDEKSDFGKWLSQNGFVFSRGEGNTRWDWLVVFR